MADIKIQAVFGQAAHTDQRGEGFVGKHDGDHHTTLKEWRVDDPAEVALILQGAELANAKVVEASTAQFDDWRERGILDEILAAASIVDGEDVSDAKFFGILTRVYDND